MTTTNPIIYVALDRYGGDKGRFPTKRRALTAMRLDTRVKVVFAYYRDGNERRVLFRSPDGKIVERGV